MVNEPDRLIAPSPTPVVTKAGDAHRMTPIAIDAKRIVTAVFPDLSLRTWRRLDSSGQCPRGLSLGGRKLWRVADLEHWAAMGFPSRDEFEKRNEPA